MISLPGEHILWKVSSSIHDWSDGLLLRDLIKEVEKLHLIDNANWIKNYEDINPRPLSAHEPDKLIAYLQSRLPTSEDEDLDLEIGGQDWALYINIFPYDPESQQVLGINTMLLRFDRSVLNDPAVLKDLAESFKKVVNPTNAEYAVIHPYKHWVELSASHYETPITIAPMFRGVYWMNFIAGGQLSEFEISSTTQVPECQCHWTSDPGFYFTVALGVEDIEKDSVEKTLLKLSQWFTAKLKKDSIWRM